MGRLLKVFDRFRSARFRTLYEAIEMGKKDGISEEVIRTGYKFFDSFNKERKYKFQERRRESIVNGASMIFAFIFGNGIAFYIIYKVHILDLLINGWGFGFIGGIIITCVWAGIICLLAVIIYWLFDITGFHYLVEDWIESWETWDVQNLPNIPKLKSYPRRKRKTLIKNLKHKLDDIYDELSHIEDEFQQSTGEDEFWEYEEESLNCDYDDIENLENMDEFQSVCRLRHVLNDSHLIDQTEASSKMLIKQPSGATWKGFVKSLRETQQDFVTEIARSDLYHAKVRPIVGRITNMLTVVLFRIVKHQDT